MGLNSTGNQTKIWLPLLAKASISQGNALYPFLDTRSTGMLRITILGNGSFCS